METPGLPLTQRTPWMEDGFSGRQGHQPRCLGDFDQKLQGWLGVLVTQKTPSLSPYLLAALNTARSQVEHVQKDSIAAG